MDSEEMHSERVRVGDMRERAMVGERDEDKEMRESQRCQDQQPLHPEMAFLQKKEQDKKEWINYVKEAEEAQEEHPEMALMRQAAKKKVNIEKKVKKAQAMEKKTEGFLSQMRSESEQGSGAKKPKF